MPEYLHECKACKKEFEDTYSIHKDPPTLCPLCGMDGQVKRLISDATFGKVLLSGTDLTSQIKKERSKLRNKIKNDENTKANVIGEDKYQQHVTDTERIKERYKS